MDLPTGHILVNALPKSQLNDCHVICMIYGCFLNNKISKLHGRCLRITSNDKKQSNFEKLLIENNYVSTHHRNIKTLVIEMYKFVNEMSPEIANKILQLRKINHYNHRHPSPFVVPPVTAFIIL